MAGVSAETEATIEALKNQQAPTCFADTTVSGVAFWDELLLARARMETREFCSQRSSKLVGQEHADSVETRRQPGSGSAPNATTRHNAENSLEDLIIHTTKIIPEKYLECEKEVPDKLILLQKMSFAVIATTLLEMDLCEVKRVFRLGLKIQLPFLKFLGRQKRQRLLCSSRKVVRRTR
ncbi:hypothetical protein KIN20_000791 [Parelaphostrongylus tenuis]|uniref:Uncharacterized protein n=1 Tax=Parelaphostrongylus tenuis TaxID=148309 RepID=A0AAD5LV96_PARTN|nr:hypothetical protein KIN20_000791 [Parelaphostrongylus tenuis]